MSQRTQVRIDLIDGAQRPVVAEVEIGPEVVEVVCRDHQSREHTTVRLPRATLAAWLSQPQQVLAVGDDGQMTWGCCVQSIWWYVRGLVPMCYLRADVVERLRRATCDEAQGSGQ